MHFELIKNNTVKKTLLFSFLFLFSIVNGQNNARFVNLFVGTTDEGNMMPGATLPFGMVQLSPDTRIDKPSGYDYKDSGILGFSHTHLSGTGLGDLGDLLTMPLSSENVNFGNGFPNFSSTFSHQKESASPGYYSVFLEKSLTKVELTATERCGLQRYSYSKETPSQGIFVDLKHSIYGTRGVWIPDAVYECQLTVEDSHTISGYKKSKGWAPQQNVYFVMKFNQPIAQFFIKDNHKITKGLKQNTDSLLQAVFLFNKPNELLVKTGISVTSIAGARMNLEVEMPDWDFNKYKKKATEIWDSHLSKIEIDGTKYQKELFYSALYHTMVTPNLVSDVDGSFFGPDFKNHRSKHGNYYSTFSLWDTYRAVHPLYTLICPDKNADFVNSMLEHFEIFGRLPIWTLWGTENYCMTGNHAIPVIVDAFLKGNSKINSELAWKAIRTSATSLFPNTTFNVKENYGYTPPYWGEYGVRGDRNRYDLIDKNGYLPHDSIRESCTSLLELCYDDWCVAQLAKKLGKTKEFDFFQHRSESYKNIFDKETGYIRPRLANGNWQMPFQPFLLSDWQTGAFVEGNAAQYTLYVPHQVDSLIALCGGARKFEAKLDSLFSIQNTEKKFSCAISGFLGQYAHGNEPSHHIAYLYNSVGKQAKTAEIITEIMKTQYTNTPKGLSGNDDCGQMSAWYVFSALGFYPVNPADGNYWLGTSQLKGATLKLENGKQLKINYIGAGKGHIYIQKIELNKKSMPLTSIHHSDLLKGGVMNVYMGEKPLK
jgi:predicted alpha-1,2-mannosidase